MIAWVWDWMHTTILLALIAATAVLIVLGHGNTVLQIFAVASGGAGVAALMKGSPRQKMAVVEPPKGDIDVTENLK